MYIHHAASLSYKEFKNEVRWLVAQVDQQNYKPLRERTCEAVRRLQRDWPLRNLGRVRYEDGVRKEVSTQEWPLLEHGGGSLATEDEIKGQIAPTPRDVGYWFLIVLAEYLQPCPSPRGNWSVLNDALEVLDWDQGDTALLFKGLPTCKLLKPNVAEKSPWPLTNSSPYWLWLHPGRAKSGWLPIEEIHRLYSQLREVEDAVRAFDVRQIPNIDASNPIVIKDYKRYLQSGYRDTLAMLSTVYEMNQSLFMSVTLS